MRNKIGEINVLKSIHVLYIERYVDLLNWGINVYLATLFLPQVGMTVTEAQQTEVEIQGKQLPHETEETASLAFTDGKRQYINKKQKR